MYLYFSDNLVLCLLIDTFFKHSYNRWDQWFRSSKRLYWGAKEIAQENWARSASIWVSNRNLLYYFNMFMIMSDIYCQHTTTIFRWNNSIVTLICWLLLILWVSNRACWPLGFLGHQKRKRYWYVDLLSFCNFMLSKYLKRLRGSDMFSSYSVDNLPTQFHITTWYKYLNVSAICQSLLR